jgi:hypothetical protein
MRRLFETGILVAVCAAWLGAAGSACGQEESPSARATRKRLKTKLTLEIKEERIGDAVGEIRREFDNKLGIKIDNVSGISNNSKVTIIAKDKTLAEILNEFCDKYEMGYIVKSDPKDRLDGWIILRKNPKYKERGYEEGKEPKEKSSSLTPPAPAVVAREAVAVVTLPPPRSERPLARRD